MTVISIRTFNGEIPRLPADRLPDGYAQFAQNCDFTHGELRPLAGLGTHYTTGSGAQPCRGLFTPDGEKFFAWDKPTRAFLAPTIDDVWGRIYYNTHTHGLRVSQRSALYDATDNPRPPASGAYWQVGVTRPNGLVPSTSTDLALDVYVQTLRYGVMVEEVPVTTTTTVTPGLIYDVVIPPGALSTETTTVVAGRTPELGVLDVTAAATLNGGGDGVPASVTVTNDEVMARYFLGDDTITFNHEVPFASLWEPRTDIAGASRWCVAQRLSGGYDLFLVGDSTVQMLRVSSIQYKGTTYATPQALYEALYAVGSTTTVTTTDGVTIRFRVMVYNSATGVVYYDGIASHIASGTPFLYTITIPAFNTLVTSSGDSMLQTVSYVAVAVNLWGEESAPSDPVVVEFRPGLTGVALEVAHAPNTAEVPIAGMLFYRTYPSANGSTSYFLINETPVTDVGGVYSISDSSTEPLTATTLAANQAEWDAPPAALESLSYAGNGVFCGAVGKDLYFSEPYKPHAWPYRMVFPHEIVGVLGVEGGVLVTTALHPYLVYGAHPEQMSQVRMTAEQSGWSDTSMTHVEGSAVYAGNDGLVTVSGGQASIKSSQDLFRREDWRKMFGAVKGNLRLAQHDGRLIGIVDPGT